MTGGVWDVRGGMPNACPELTAKKGLQLGEASGHPAAMNSMGHACRTGGLRDDRVRSWTVTPPQRAALRWGSRRPTETAQRRVLQELAEPGPHRPQASGAARDIRHPRYGDLHMHPIPGHMLTPWAFGQAGESRPLRNKPMTHSGLQTKVGHVSPRHSFDKQRFCVE